MAPFVGVELDMVGILGVVKCGGVGYDSANWDDVEYDVVKLGIGCNEENDIVG